MNKAPARVEGKKRGIEKISAVNTKCANRKKKDGGKSIILRVESRAI